MKKIILSILLLTAILGIVFALLSCKPNDGSTENTSPIQYTISISAPETVIITIKTSDSENFESIENVYVVQSGDLIKIENAPTFTFSAIEGEPYTMLVGLEETSDNNVFKVISNVRIYVSLNQN